jgi:hypothetical protein
VGAPAYYRLSGRIIIGVVVFGNLDKQPLVPVPAVLAVQSEGIVFKILQDGKTKAWHFSELTLADVFYKEMETGEAEFPDVGY